MAPHDFPLDASQPSLATWETGYGRDGAHATQPRSFQFGCPGEESNDDFINITPVPAQHTQWWSPEDGVAGWDGADSESRYSSRPPSESTDIGLPTDGDPTPSASSSSTAPDSLTHPPPPTCDVTYTGMENAMYMDGSSWAEQFMTTGAEPSTEFNWGDNAVFEPYVASQQSESTQSQSVRPFLQVTIF